MSAVMQELSYSANLLNNIISDIEGQAEKDVAQRIIKLFDESGFTIKVKHLFPTKPFAYYRVLCFIKKSNESIIINTKKDCGREGVIKGMNIQLRIENKTTLSKLDEFSDNIRNQILNANDCGYCSSKCEGKRYIFDYLGNKYVKCQFLCSNFRFEGINGNDIASLEDIINREIEYKQTRS